MAFLCSPRETLAEKLRLFGLIPLRFGSTCRCWIQSPVQEVEPSLNEPRQEMRGTSQLLRVCVHNQNLCAIWRGFERCEFELGATNEENDLFRKGKMLSPVNVRPYCE